MRQFLAIVSDTPEANEFPLMSRFMVAVFINAALETNICVLCVLCVVWWLVRDKGICHASQRTGSRVAEMECWTNSRWTLAAKITEKCQELFIEIPKIRFFLFYIFIILCSEHECRTFYCRNCLHFDWIVFGHVYLGKNVIRFNAFHSIFVDLVATFLFHSLSLAKRALSSWRYMQKSSSRENRFCGATKLHQNNIHSVYPWLK